MVASRFLDICLSAFIIIVLAPLFVLIGLILKFTGEGEVIFKQERVGYSQKTFNVYKFATMKKNSANLPGGAITLPNDPRVLPFGKILRKTKLNELPQVFNIFVGEMSFVGPRPLMKKQFNFYSDAKRSIISSVRPGLTGLGSIYFRDEESLFKGSKEPDKLYQEVITPIKEILEEWFVRNRGILLYFKILILTFVAVFFNINWVGFIIDADTKEQIDGLQDRLKLYM